MAQTRAAASRRRNDSLHEQLRQAACECARKHLPLRAVREEFERLYIEAVLDETRQNRSRASEILGIHRNTLGHKVGT